MSIEGRAQENLGCIEHPLLSTACYFKLFSLTSDSTILFQLLLRLYLTLCPMHPAFLIQNRFNTKTFHFVVLLFFCRKWSRSCSYCSFGGKLLPCIRKQTFPEVSSQGGDEPTVRSWGWRTWLNLKKKIACCHHTNREQKIVLERTTSQVDNFLESIKCNLFFSKTFCPHLFHATLGWCLGRGKGVEWGGEGLLNVTSLMLKHTDMQT